MSTGGMRLDPQEEQELEAVCRKTLIIAFSLSVIIVIILVVMYNFGIK